MRRNAKSVNATLVSRSPAALSAAVVVVLGTIFVYNNMISNQEARNERLTDEIAQLEKSIEEIDGLERQKERMLARMEIIEQLQKSRPEIVHLFDEMARQLPEGVYLTGMKQQGRNVEVRGVAQSSTRVSALMRQVDSSRVDDRPRRSNELKQPLRAHRDRLCSS